MHDTLHNNWIVGFASWLAIILRALGLVAFYIGSVIALFAVAAAIAFCVGLALLWAGIHVMLWIWPLQ